MADVRVAVIGGGFGGLETALRLDRMLDPREAEIILIDRSPFHTLRPKLPQAVGARIPCSVHIPFEAIVQETGVRFVRRPVADIDLEHRMIEFEDRPDGLTYDVLVLAAGGEVRPPSAIAGAEQALAVWSFDQACSLRRRIGFLVRAAASGKPVDCGVAIIGGGFVGCELAAEIQARLNRIAGDIPSAKVTLIEAEDRILSNLPARVSVVTRRRLEQLGARVIPSSPAAEVQAGGVVLEGGDLVEAGTIVWAGGGIDAPSFLRGLIEREGFLASSAAGRLPVDRKLNLPARPEVFALGDCAKSLNGPAGADAPSAHRAQKQAKVVARNIVALLRGGKAIYDRSEPARYLLGLGPKYGVLAAPPLPVTAGLLPSIVKEAVILRHLWRLGGRRLVRRAGRCVCGDAAVSSRWDGDPLPEGDVLASS